MLADLRSWFGAMGKGSGAAEASDRITREPVREPASTLRQSSGIQEFLESIRDQIGLTVLDLSGCCEQNVAFITGLSRLSI